MIFGILSPRATSTIFMEVVPMSKPIIWECPRFIFPLRKSNIAMLRSRLRLIVARFHGLRPVRSDLSATLRLLPRVPRPWPSAVRRLPAADRPAPDLFLRQVPRPAVFFARHLPQRLPVLPGGRGRVRGSCTQTAHPRPQVPFHARRRRAAGRRPWRVLRAAEGSPLIRRGPAGVSEWQAGKGTRFQSVRAYRPRGGRPNVCFDGYLHIDPRAARGAAKRPGRGPRAAREHRR